MPDGLDQTELEKAMLSATDGPCVAFQPKARRPRIERGTSTDHSLARALPAPYMH